MSVSTLAGLCLVALAVLHFAFRERAPGERSVFIGGLGSTTSARTSWAFVELTLGGAILLLT